MSGQFMASRSTNLLAAVLLAAAAVYSGASAPCSRAQAAGAKAEDYAAAKKHARAVAKEWLDRGIPGVTLAVAVDRKIVYAEGFGYADLEQRGPGWPHKKF